MRCISCGEPLAGLPLYNNKDESYPDNLLFCQQVDCRRFGVLTVVFAQDDKGKKGKRKGVQPKDV